MACSVVGLLQPNLLTIPGLGLGAWQEAMGVELRPFEQGEQGAIAAAADAQLLPTLRRAAQNATHFC